MVEEERDPRLPLERKTVRLVDGRKRNEERDGDAGKVGKIWGT
jgi:hypothetical protein